MPTTLDLGSVALKSRRTKIVATLGPASSSPAAVRALLAAGVDVVRLNFSHGDHASHRLAARRVRGAARALGRHVPILADLAGPKMRTGRFAGGSIELRAGEAVIVTVGDVLGGPGLIPSQYRRLPHDVRRGQPIFLADGTIELRVVRVGKRDVTCRVAQGGRLRDHQGINLPGSAVSLPSLTAKDRRDAAAAVDLGADFLALSFVRRAADVEALRSLLARLGARAPIVAKVEKPQALDNIDGILAAADAVMVARGDLGVELPPERVPIVQRELVRLANERNRPVIVATQMLESMTDRPRPTRAEVNDVASAAFAGADAVMLSAETATGRHPLEAVRVMDRILREVEGYLWSHGAFGGWEHPLAGPADPARLHDAIGRAAAQLSRDLAVRCVVVPTRSGVSARSVSADRPAAPVLALVADERVCRQVALLWGVVPVKLRGRGQGQAAVEAAGRRAARALGLASRGDRLLLVRGFEADPRRSVPTLTVITV